MQTKQKVLVGQHVHERAILIRLWEAAKKQTQELVNIYNDMGLPALKSDSVGRFVNDTEMFILEQLGANDMQIGGLKLQPAAAWNIIQKPDGLENLKQKIDAYKQKCSTSAWCYNSIRVGFQPNTIAKYFCIDEKVTVQFTDNHSGFLDEYGKYYASTDRAIDVVGFLNDVGAAFYKNGLNKYYGDGRLDGHTGKDHVFKRIVSAILSVDHKTQSIVINADRFRSGDFGLSD